jgi:uncharacterized protein with HEPN domain
MSLDPDLRWKLRILHIRDAAEKILTFSANRSFDDFVSDDMLHDGILRNFQIIGEAAKKVPSDVRQKYPEIPWQRMADFRNVIVHDYDDLNAATIWRTIENDIPPLLQNIRAMNIREEDFE